jgi:hypothetical protein
MCSVQKEQDLSAAAAADGSPDMRQRKGLCSSGANVGGPGHEPASSRLWCHVCSEGAKAFVRSANVCLGRHDDGPLGATGDGQRRAPVARRRTATHPCGTGSALQGNLASWRRLRYHDADGSACHPRIRRDPWVDVRRRRSNLRRLHLVTLRQAVHRHRRRTASHDGTRASCTCVVLRRRTRPQWARPFHPRDDHVHVVL